MESYKEELQSDALIKNLQELVQSDAPIESYKELEQSDAPIESHKEGLLSVSPGPSGLGAEKQAVNEKLSHHEQDLMKNAEAGADQQASPAEEFAYLKTRMIYHKLSSAQSEKKKGPMKVMRMDDTGAEEPRPQATSLSPEQPSYSNTSTRKTPQESRPPCEDKVVSAQDSGAEEGTKVSNDDLMKAEQEDLQKASRAEECSILAMKLNELSASITEKKCKNTQQLSSDLQTALSLQQRAVEERDQLAQELKAARGVYTVLKAAVATEMSKSKMVNQLQDWSRQVKERTPQLEESEDAQADLHASLQSEQERYEKLSLEYQALLCWLQDVTKADTSQSGGHLEKNQQEQQTSIVHGDHSGKQPCKCQSTFLEPGEEMAACGHENILVELQRLASKYEVLLCDYQRLQVDHQALKSAQHELESSSLKKPAWACTLKMVSTQTESESGGRMVGPEIQPALGQFQEGSPKVVEGLTDPLAEQQERHKGELSSSMSQLRDSTEVVTKAQEQLSTDNVEQQQEDQLTAMAVQNNELDQVKSDNAALKQELQAEKDCSARLRRKIEKRDRMIQEMKEARANSLLLDQGVTEQCLELIKQLKTDNARLHRGLLEEADRNRAYEVKTEAILAENKQKLGAAVKDAITSQREVEDLKAKLTAKEKEAKEVKELINDTKMPFLKQC
ncbi:kinesin heavy chain-like isoform X2 [Engraulis encrasicolus]|uniref:kinesin heavy chain-like isoform X2 n=1 Tax=Engraulis encrasicolus TaxID=184585 RepID=UPI002FD30798